MAPRCFCHVPWCIHTAPGIEEGYDAHGTNVAAGHGYPDWPGTASKRTKTVECRPRIHCIRYQGYIRASTPPSNVGRWTADHATSRSTYPQRRSGLRSTPAEPGARHSAPLRRQARRDWRTAPTPPGSRALPWRAVANPSGSRRGLDHQAWSDCLGCLSCGEPPGPAARQSPASGSGGRIRIWSPCKSRSTLPSTLAMRSPRAAMRSCRLWI